MARFGIWFALLAVGCPQSDGPASEGANGHGDDGKAADPLPEGRSAEAASVDRLVRLGPPSGSAGLGAVLSRDENGVIVLCTPAQALGTEVPVADLSLTGLESLPAQMTLDSAIVEHVAHQAAAPLGAVTVDLSDIQAVTLPVEAAKTAMDAHRTPACADAIRGAVMNRKPVGMVVDAVLADGVFAFAFEENAEFDAPNAMDVARTVLGLPQAKVEGTTLTQRVSTAVRLDAKLAVHGGLGGKGIIDDLIIYEEFMEILFPTRPKPAPKPAPQPQPQPQPQPDPQP